MVGTPVPANVVAVRRPRVQSATLSVGR